MSPADDAPSDHEPAVPELPAPWRARVPTFDDIDALVELRRIDELQGTGQAHAQPAGIESEVAGEASWTRRQLVAVSDDDVPRAWITVHDRAAGRALIWGYFDREVAEVDQIAQVFYEWAEGAAIAASMVRGITETRLDESPFAADSRQHRWLTAAGYRKRRTWLHMVRPVTTRDADFAPREGVTIRPVDKHENQLPVAADLQAVHHMLETSFEDHFNNYRESFPEFVQRMREEPGHRWDHWWLAYVTDDADELVPAGAIVCSVSPGADGGPEGSYVEYIGVNRHARGRGVAKSLLGTVIADAAERGRDRVGLEVDADSPTSADQLYRSLGWETDYITESWFKDLTI